jgi:ComF family protein
VQLTGLLWDLLDFCLPATCACCGEAAVSSFLCQRCNAGLTQLEASAACQWCAMPIAEPDAPCPNCRGNGVPHYDRIAALGKFQEPIKTLVHQLKYRRRWTAGELLGQQLAGCERIRKILDTADCLVPVPLHRLRQISRGYNQADVISTGLALRHKLPICRPAIRSRNTETQTHLHSHARRAENLKDAFKLVKPECIEGRNVVVVDDVTTSGSTLQALARTLVPALPKRLCAIVIGIADPRGRQFEGI